MRALPLGHRQLIEGFFTGGITGIFSFRAASTGTQNALVPRVSQVIQGLRGEIQPGGAFRVLVREHITQVKHDKRYLTLLSASTRLSSGSESCPEKLRADCW